MTTAADPTPAVSVVVPVYIGGEDRYRRLAFLEECLASLRGQGFTDWEVLVVDDGSVEGEAISELVQRQHDRRFRYTRHGSNRGLGAARNTGFRTARGSQILPLDADDRLAPEFLERTSAVLSGQPEIDCVFTQLRVFGEVDEIWPLRIEPWAEILRSQWLPGPGTLMRRGVWELVGGYAEIDELLGNEDWDFWIAALKQGVRASAIARPLYWYRRWGGSLTFRYPPQDGHVSRRIIYRRHQAAFREHGHRREFLAGGYMRSAVAARQLGKRRASLLAAMQGLALAPRDHRLWLALAASVVGPDLERRARRVIGTAQAR